MALPGGVLALFFRPECVRHGQTGEVEQMSAVGSGIGVRADRRCRRAHGMTLDRLEVSGHPFEHANVTVI
jgi:hypothetical protein